MEENIKTTNKCNVLIGFTIIAILFFALGYIIALMSSGMLSEQALDKEKIIQQAKEEIKNWLVKRGVVPPAPEEIYVLFDGTVKEVGESYLLVVPSPRQDPFGDIFPETIKILVDENTEIDELTLKDRKGYIQELEKYERNPEESTEPSLYIRHSSEIREIKPDYYIQEIRSEKDIKGVEEFTAGKISFSIKRLY